MVDQFGILEVLKRFPFVVARRSPIPASPAGLTTQVGFIRLAHERNPNSGEPEFGGPSASQEHFAKKMDCRVKPGNDGGETVPTISQPFQPEPL